MTSDGSWSGDGEPIDTRRRGDRLRPLGRPTQPEQRVGGSGRHRRREVDLRQVRSTTWAHGAIGADAPTRPWPPCAVGRRGSSPGASTRPMPPGITVMPSGPATACRRTTTWAVSTRPPRGTPARSASSSPAPSGASSQAACPSGRSTAAGQEPAQRRVLEHARAVGVGQHDAALRARRRAGPGTPDVAGRAALDRIDGASSAAGGRRRRSGRARRACAATTRPLRTTRSAPSTRWKPSSAGQRRVLDVGRVVDAAGEQHDARAGDGRRARPGRRRTSAGKPLIDARSVLPPGAEQLVGDARHHRPVEQRVARDRSARR